MLHKHNDMRKLEYEMVRNEVKMNNSVKWSWFKVPVKVKQINENLFSDTTISNNIKETTFYIETLLKFSKKSSANAEDAQCELKNLRYTNEAGM